MLNKNEIFLKQKIHLIKQLGRTGDDDTGSPSIELLVGNIEQ
jgi:hypothetical protein